MHQSYFIFLFFYFPSAWANFEVQQLPQFFQTVHEQISESSLKNLEKGDVFSHSTVESTEEIQGKIKAKKQSMRFYIAGLHGRNCTQVLRKLSLYEQYKDFLSFLEKSDYDENKQKIFLLMNSPLLPFKMSLEFKLPRITAPGIYDYSFEHGIFNGLKGKIHVYNYQKKCLFYTNAFWSGKDTGIPNMIVEMFSQTLSKIAMEKLFRMTAI